LSNIKVKIKIENNGNQKRFSTKIELKDPNKHKFVLKRKERKPIYFAREEPKGKLAGQNEKTAKRSTKVKRRAFFGKGNYKSNPPKRKRSNQKQATAKKITLFAGGKKGSNKIELDKAWGNARNIRKEKPHKKPTEFKKLTFFSKKKKESIDGLSGINVSDKRPTKVKRHAFFGKKKPLEKISDDHKTIAPLPSGLDVERPFISPISETKFEAVTDTEKQPPAKIELKDPDKHKFLLKRKERKPIHFMGKKPKEEKPHKKPTEFKKLTFFSKKKKESIDGLSGINVSDKRPTKVKRHAFFKRKKPLEKISDDHKTIAPLPSGLDVERPFISPILETKLEKVTDGGKLKLEDVKRLKLNTLKKLGFSTKESWTELDFYPLIEPFAYAEIIRDTKTLDRRYILMEIVLSGEESKNLEFIKETLRGFTSDTGELESKGTEKYLMDKVEQIIEDYMLEIGEESKKKIKYFLKKKYLGLDRLEPIMKDPNIEDISCDGSDVSLFLYHRIHGSLKSNVKFEDEDELSAFVVKLSQRCGKHISIASPMLDATMPDGSRIQMTLSDEVTTRGSTFTIRKFKEYPFSPADLIEFNTMSSDMMAYLWMAVENGISALFAGGTASGKTSSLNALALFIPPEAKIVSIEETREINLPHHNWIPGVSRSGFGEVVGDKVVGEIDLYDLMKAALRQRPEYILVGEIRGKEAYVLFQAMATGHTTYSTVHADSAKSLIHRLEGKPINIPRIMLQALDIICIQGTSRVKDKRVRRCKQIIEIVDIDPTTKEILTNEVFRWDPIEDKFIYSGKSYILERIRAEKDLSREEMTNEIKNRATLMEWMRKENIKDFKEVAAMTANYIENPLEVMKSIGKDIQYV
jgi:archaeal flagellar protein FlaI